MADRRLDNWLLAYSKYTEGTESPALYHLWTGLSTIASAAQRKIYMDFGYFKTHTNMYIVLTGPSGVRKSTALRLGKELIQNAAKYGTKINLSSNATSVAALIQQFVKLSGQDHQSLTTYSSEFGTLVRSSDTDIVGFLTDIYDCEPGWDKQTIARALELIEKPWLNILGATTPDWMMENLGKLSLEGGFVRRVLFVYQDTCGLIAYPEMTDEQKKLKQDLTHDLSIIAALSGQFKFEDAETKEFYREWYEDPTRLHTNTESRLRGYYSVKAEHLKKVAMSISLSESNALTVSMNHLKAGLGMLEEIEGGMLKALSAVGKNPFNTDLDRIVHQVIHAGRISYKKLFLLNVHALEKRQFDETLATLLEIGKLFVETGVFYSQEEWDKHNDK